MAGENSNNQPWSENFSDEESMMDTQIIKDEPEEVEEKHKEEDLNDNKDSDNLNKNPESKSHKGKTQATAYTAGYKKALEDVIGFCQSLLQKEVEDSGDDSGEDSGEDSDVSDTTND